MYDHSLDHDTLAFPPSHPGEDVHPDHTATSHDIHLEDLFSLTQVLHLGALGNLLDALHQGNTGMNTAALSQMGPLGHILELLLPVDEQSLDASLQGSAAPYVHFQPGEDMAAVIGNPAADMAAWHEQSNADTCAIVSQEFIIESLTGQHVSEETLRHEAELHGWYTPGGGTPLAQVGNLLEEFGIHVQHEQGTSLEELAASLGQHHKVIAAVNAEDIWYRGGPYNSLASYPGIPGQQADHAVEVIGIDDTISAHPMVILNDPGTPDGRGIEIPLAVFAEAWATSGNYMVTTTDEPPATADTIYAQAQNSTLGGYYNADGAYRAYHYDSDDTDRDSQTGAIIRRW